MSHAFTLANRVSDLGVETAFVVAGQAADRDFVLVVLALLGPAALFREGDQKHGGGGC